MKQLYIIDYENAHWCGGQLNCLAWAKSPEEAVIIAEGHMEDAQRELFSDEFGDVEDDEDAGDYDDVAAFTVNSVEIMDCNHEDWKFFMDPTQSQFYPIVN